MIYLVKRDKDTLTILKAIDSINGLKREDYVEINDEEINSIIDKNISSKTVTMDIYGKLTFTNEKFYGVDIKDTKRVQIIQKAKTNLDSLVKDIDMIDYIDYIDINNEFYEYGIFITESNREEKYLEILETGDEHKIDLLEDLLLIKDRINAIKFHRSTFQNILDQVIKLEENDPELDKILETI